mgnify:CR=1 FL=1
MKGSRKKEGIYISVITTVNQACVLMKRLCQLRYWLNYFTHLPTSNGPHQSSFLLHHNLPPSLPLPIHPSLPPSLHSSLLSLPPSLSLSLSLSLFPSARLIQSTNLTQSQFQLSKLTGDTRLGDDHLLRVDILYDGSNRETLRYAVPSDGIVMAEIPTNQTTTKLDVQAFVSHRPHPISRTSPRPQPHSINVDVTPRTSSFRTSRQLTGKICVVTIEWLLISTYQWPWPWFSSPIQIVVTHFSIHS